MLIYPAIFIFLGVFYTIFVLHILKLLTKPMSWKTLVKVFCGGIFGIALFVFGLACCGIVGYSLGKPFALASIGLFCCFAFVFVYFLTQLQQQEFAIKAGFFMGGKLHDILPKWFRICIGIVLLALVGFSVWLLVQDFSQQKHYKRLQYVANSIFQAEQAYYAKHGQYTANMKRLGVELPVMAHEQYNKGGYTYDNGEKVETPETYSAYTAEGDSFLVEVSGIEDDPKALNLPTLLEIDALGKPGTLPATYSIYHFFGADQPETPLLFQCQATILHNTEAEAEKDIRKGGNFCKRLGAQPSNNRLIWLF